MRRFFIEPFAINKDSGHLTGNEARHIIRTLRLQAGDHIELFDGRGSIFRAEITYIHNNKKEVEVRIMESEQETDCSATNLTLIQALLKGKKMDFLVQKATELGVQCLVPALTKFSENRGDRSRQVERWKRIIIEACKQSNRAVPMEILPPIDFFDALSVPCSTKIMLWENENNNTFGELITPTNNGTCLCIGPEGGFHVSEVDLAKQAGFVTASLGPHILRAETASLAAVSVTQFLLGGLRPKTL